MNKGIVILCIICLSVAVSCKRKQENRVPPEQIQIDGSTDYSVVLKDIIEREKKEKKRYKKGPFDE